MTILRAAAFAAALTLAAGGAHAAPAISWTGSSDAAFLAWLAGRGASLPGNEVAVAQARGGNNATNGDYEIGLHIPPGFTNAGPVGPAGQQAWGSQGGGNPFVAFSLTRSGTTLTFTMGSYTGSYTDASVADIDALGLRLRGGNQGSRTGSAALRNLVLDATALGGLSASNDGLSFAVIEGLSGDFTLAGEAALNWTGGAAIPAGSRLGFQIKALDLPMPVAEPATLGLLGAGLAGLGLARRCRRRR